MVSKLNQNNLDKFAQAYNQGEDLPLSPEGAVVKETTLHFDDVNARMNRKLNKHRAGVEAEKTDY
jgi:hypothetical protein